MQENYLAKWLNGELTEAELAEFKNSAEYKTYERIAKTSKNLEAPDFKSSETYEAIKNRKELNGPKVVQLNPYKGFLKVAAAAAIIMLGAFLYLESLDESIVTKLAENKEIVLPDASEVFLNADSQISYDDDNWQNERNLQLIGEAYFKVAKGQRFTVHTEAGNVAVLGTKFNVHQREGHFEVTCYEGLVSVSYKDIKRKLSMGESFKVIDGVVMNTQEVLEAKPSWLNKESSFKSIPLKYVLKEFERQHNMETSIQNVDTEQLYTGTFSNTDVELALKSISVPSQIKFKLEGGKVLFYGD